MISIKEIVTQYVMEGDAEQDDAWAAFTRAGALDDFDASEIDTDEDIRAFVKGHSAAADFTDEQIDRVVSNIKKFDANADQVGAGINPAEPGDPDTT